MNTCEDSHVFNHFYLPRKPGFLSTFFFFLFSHLTSISCVYLERHPDTIDLCSRPGEGGCPGPDGEQGGLSLNQLQNRLGDRALILVAGHHKVKDDERGEAEEAHHGDEGKPVHLPVHRTGWIQKKRKVKGINMLYTW